MNLKKAEILFEEGKINEALEAIRNLWTDDVQNADLYLLRAKCNIKVQNWGNALNDLNVLLELDPENKIAGNYKAMVMDIIRFWNKDNFNP